ncbi:MAG: right-handed parallel beta-helix repeat-containing protein [Armatimonadetes bacterium]|nr:right-handed parallel beta-helix repeat-containing protein [Armatimonadota bacterium]
MDGIRTAVMLVSATAALVAANFAGAQTAVNQEKIDAVLAGKEKVARASWWGFSKEEATAALQAAIDSGAEKVIVEDLGAPWIVDKIALASNQEIVFEKGVVVEAKRGAFKGKGDCLFTARLKENITLSGYGATFRMHKADYQGPDYDKAEWRHTLSLLSSKNVKVLGLTLAESGGDGIYVGVGQAGVPCTDIVIKDVTCDKNHRQGISVISARNLLIENTIMRETSGTPPMAGIDFEPNGPTEELTNCVMRNCVSENNQGDGYDFYIPTLNATSAAVSIRLEGCKSIGNGRALVFTTGNGPDAAVKGNAEFIDCTFEGSRGSGVIINNKPAAGFPMRFARCSVVNCGVEQPGQPPILFATQPDASEPIGNVRFEDCTLVDPVERQPMTLSDFSGGIPAIDITGTLVLERNGKREVLELTDELLDKWMPSRKLKVIAPFDMTDVRLVPLATNWKPEELAGAMRLRNAFRLVLYAQQGDAVSFTMRYAQLGRYSGNPMPVKVTAPSGTVVLDAKGEFMKDTGYEFTAPETGAYGIALDSGANTAQVTQTTNPYCVVTGGDPIHFLSTIGDVFFYVPATVTEFGLKVFGEGSGEGVHATLYDSQDQLVGDQDDITQPHQFVVERGATAEGEVWRLHLAKPSGMAMEDFHVQLQGLPPVIAPTKASLLIPKVQ